MKAFVMRAAGAAIAIAALSATPTGAQTVPDTNDVPSAASLNLPAEITMFGKADPHVRKATAIVNGEIITGTDIDQRLALIVLANGGKISDEERERLKLQLLRNLIDETLQIQEAKSHDVKISQDEIDQTFAGFARRSRRTPEAMIAYLREQGSSERSIKRQIEGELAWSRLIRRRIESQVNVSDDEVNAIIARLEAAKGSDEFRVGEIYLSATPETQDQVAANARKIIEQIKQGGSFAAYARQFSEASTAPVGGDLGWVRPGVLPDSMAAALKDMAVGQVVGPIPVPPGFSIVYLADRRKVLTADPRDAVLNLRQMSIKFDASVTEAAATAQAEALAKATQAMGGCGKVDDVAKTLGAEVVDNDRVKVRDLPAPLQDMLLGLNVGQATQPFGSKTDGVRVLVLCGRDDAAGAAAPNPEEIRNRIEGERVNLRAQRYLRDLRRDAVIEYR